MAPAPKSVSFSVNHIPRYPENATRFVQVVEKPQRQLRQRNKQVQVQMVQGNRSANKDLPTCEETSVKLPEKIEQTAVTWLEPNDARVTMERCSRAYRETTIGTPMLCHVKRLTNVQDKRERAPGPSQLLTEWTTNDERERKIWKCRLDREDPQRVDCGDNAPGETTHNRAADLRTSNVN